MSMFFLSRLQGMRCGIGQKFDKILDIFAFCRSLIHPDPSLSLTGFSSRCTPTVEKVTKIPKKFNWFKLLQRRMLKALKYFRTGVFFPYYKCKYS
jgi:hypothetical protein